MPPERIADQLLGGSSCLVLVVGLMLLGLLAGLGPVWRRRSLRKPDEGHQA